MTKHQLFSSAVSGRGAMRPIILTVHCMRKDKLKLTKDAIGLNYNRHTTHKNM